MHDLHVQETQKISLVRELCLFLNAERRIKRTAAEKGKTEAKVGRLALVAGKRARRVAWRFSVQ